MNEIKDSKWNKALLDCVSGGSNINMKLELGREIDKELFRNLTERAASPGWDGNVYKYRF